MSSEPRASRKVRTGVVVSDKRDKTVTVSIELQFQHPKYGKIVKKTRKLHAHDDSFDAKVGDTVKVGFPAGRCQLFDSSGQAFK